MSQENIVSKIISEAEERAERTVSDAARKAEESAAKARREAEESAAERLAQATVRAEANARQREISARLEIRRIELDQKHKVVDGVFDKALQILVSLPEKEYVGFIQSLLERYAEAGDVVVLSGNCKYRASVEKLPIMCEKGLVLSKEAGRFAGGVMLVGGACDKNLSFEALVATAKEQKQAEVAAALFG